MFVSLHLALAKLDPSCLIEALSIYCSLHLCHRTGFPPLFLDLVYQLFCPPALAFTESVISFHIFTFSAFVMAFVYFDLIMVMLFATSSHKKTKSALEKFSSLRLFSFEQTISDIFLYKKYYGIMGYYPLVKLLIHWLLIHSTIQRLSNVKLSSGYSTNWLAILSIG
jgi:hypothetical protein